MANLKNKTALITGASSGLGVEFAELFAQDGYHLILVARTQNKLEALAVELKKKYSGVQCHVIPADLSQTEGPQKLFSQVQAQGLSVDILVNNAGVGLQGAFDKNTWAREKEMIQLNITSVTELTKLFLPQMLAKKWGKVMNVASTAAFEAGPWMAVYYATKAYVVSFSDAIARELRGTGVTVTAFCPGPTLTGFAKAADINEAESLLFKVVAMNARSTAELGYRATMAGRSVSIAGIRNHLINFLVWISPRFLVTETMYWVQKGH